MGVKVELDAEGGPDLLGVVISLLVAGYDARGCNCFKNNNSAKLVLMGGVTSCQQGCTSCKVIASLSCSLIRASCS